jgi:hypothetical protein
MASLISDAPAGILLHGDLCYRAGPLHVEIGGLLRRSPTSAARWGRPSQSVVCQHREPFRPAAQATENNRLRHE